MSTSAKKKSESGSKAITDPKILQALAQMLAGRQGGGPQHNGPTSSGAKRRPEPARETPPRRAEADSIVREAPSIDAVSEEERRRYYILAMPGRVFLVDKRRWASLYSLEVNDKFMPKDKIVAGPLVVAKIPFVCVVDRERRRYLCVSFDVSIAEVCYAKPEKCKKAQGLGAPAASPPWYLYMLPGQVVLVGTDREYKFVRFVPGSYGGVGEESDLALIGNIAIVDPSRRAGEVEVWTFEVRGGDLPDGRYVGFTVLHTPWGRLIKFGDKFYTSGAELAKELRRYTDNEDVIKLLTKEL